MFIQKEASSRTHHNSGVEKRGRKLKLSGEQVREADHILQDDDLQLEAKRYTWAQLAMEVGVDVSGHTM